MKKWIFSLAIGLVSTFGQAQDSLSVLFIGNSYTASNNLPAMINSVANSFGDQISWIAQSPGGATLANHAANNTTYTNISANSWDYVVLQAQSQEPSFPDNQVDTQTIPYAIQIADSVYANRFCSEVMMFMTWGRKDGDPQWAPISTFEGMNGRLRSAYMRMADSVQGSVSPVGSAWAWVRANYPSLGDSLYVGDGSHPSVAGSYLIACTFYASLFRENPIGSSYTAGLSNTTIGILQQAAALTVLDSLDQWNLRPLSEHTQAAFTHILNGNTVDFTNESTKAQFYAWDFGDGATSTDENPSHTYSISGTYTVSLIASSECDSDTSFISLTMSVNGILEEGSEAKIQYLGEGIYHFEFTEGNGFEQLSSMDGRILLFSQGITEVDLSSYGKGIYILQDAKGGVYRLPYLTD